MSGFVPSEDMKITGIFVASTLECMGAYKPFAQKILAERGQTEFKPDQWYDAVGFLKLFADMDAKFGPNTVFTIGRKTIEYAPFPPGTGVESGLIILTQAYPVHHKGTDIGYVRYTKTGEHSGTVVAHTPYPCDWERGAIVTVGERFKQPGQIVKVVHDDTKPCRKKGGLDCTYNVSW